MKHPFLTARECQICQKKEEISSESLGFCLNCLREEPKKSLILAKKAHRKVRKIFGLPPFPPKDPKGIKCNICANFCQIGEGQKGYCGLRENKKGKLESKVNANLGLLYAYFDPLPTNCSAGWFCQAEKEGAGKSNLAVFFYGCSFDCLFCQNYSHKLVDQAPKVKIDDLLKIALLPQTFCLCFFGGSPEPQLPFAINFSKKILEKKKIRICLEWNGIGNENLVRKMAELSLKSRGIIKFDLKAFNENLSFALSGVSNRQAFRNFEMIAKEFLPKADYPMLTATTLLVPGYVDKIEVEKISKFIASLNPEIPYSLLVFFPAFFMKELPITPREQVEECYQVAKKYLKNVNIGNKHLLEYGK